jgi:hypothetical protein
MPRSSRIHTSSLDVGPITHEHNGIITNSQGNDAGCAWRTHQGGMLVNVSRNTCSPKVTRSTATAMLPAGWSAAPSASWPRSQWAIAATACPLARSSPFGNFTGLASWDYHVLAPWTPDGGDTAQLASVAPQVSGQIAERRIGENQFVRAGTVPATISEMTRPSRRSL